jgi:nucleolar protein 56
VATAVVLARGPRFFLVRLRDGPPVEFALASPRGASVPDSAGGSELPAGLLASIRGLPSGVDVRAASERLADSLRDDRDRPAPLATIAELREARTTLPPWDPKAERRELLREARTTLDRALRTPEEILITLAREEERLERAVGREARASEAFLTVPESPLLEYAARWNGVRKSMRAHHAALEETIRSQARSVVPNLAGVVGERTAARLVSAAGSVDALARMRAGRIQLLGTRRRPSPERGPRYGILYRADGMDRVPPARQGAYARSLGALAAIAVRADATTKAVIFPRLAERRDRRISQLRARH